LAYGKEAGIWKEVVAICFKVLYWHRSEETEWTRL